MSVLVEERGGVRVLSAEAACGEAESVAFRDAMLANQAAERLVVDISSAPVMDSCHLATLIAATLGVQPGHRVVVCAHLSVLEKLVDWRLDSVVSVYGDLAEAIAAVEGVRQ